MRWLLLLCGLVATTAALGASPRCCGCGGGGSTTTTTLPPFGCPTVDIIWHVTPSGSAQELVGLAAVYGQPGSPFAISERELDFDIFHTTPSSIAVKMIHGAPSPAPIGTPMFIADTIYDGTLHGVLIPSDSNTWTLVARRQGTDATVELWQSTLTAPIAGSDTSVAHIAIRDATDATASASGIANGFYSPTLDFSVADPLFTTSLVVPGTAPPFDVPLGPAGRQNIVVVTAMGQDQDTIGQSFVSTFSWAGGGSALLLESDVNTTIPLFLEHLVQAEALGCPTSPSSTTTTTIATTTTTTAGATTTTTSGGTTTTTTSTTAATTSTTTTTEGSTTTTTATTSTTTTTGTTSTTTTIPIACTSLTASGSNTDATSYTTASISPSANALILSVVVNSHTSALAPTSITGGGITTWHPLTGGSVGYHGGLRRLTVACGQEASPGSGTVTYDYNGVTQTGAGWALVQCTGVTVGADCTAAVRQVTSGTASSATSLAITLGAFAQAQNGTFGAFAKSSSLSTIDHGTGFTTASETGNTDMGRLLAEWRTDNDTSVDASTTGSTNNWGGVALELVAP